MNTASKIAVGVVTASFLTVAGCSYDADAEEQNDTPSVVVVGKKFTHDGYPVKTGWKVVKEPYGGANIKNLRVTNGKDSREVVQFTFTFTKNKGKVKLGEVECNGGELEPGQTAKMDCFSLDDKFPKGYTEVRVADMW